jgi:hypothetical protein
MEILYGAKVKISLNRALTEKIAVNKKDITVVKAFPNK